MFDSTIQCGQCKKEYTEIKDLAVHMLDHLHIDIPFLEICPFCDEQSTNLAEGIKHIFVHLPLDNIEEAKLIIWLSSLHEDEHSKQWKHEFDNFYIILPIISSNLKCLYCDKLIYPQNKLIRHAFEHIPEISSQKRDHLRVWFNEFFKNEDSKTIINSYCNFLNETKTLDLNSHLLGKLSSFESKETNTCRYCKLTVANASILYQHYVERHSDFQVSAWNCPLCNFKEINSDKFLEHVYKKHLACVLCRKKFPSFQACRDHSRNCLKGCPYCKNKFQRIEDLRYHLNHQREGLICPYCRERRIEPEQLKGHMHGCDSRPTVNVFCPFCKTSEFTQEERLQNHLKECKPWIQSVPRDMPCMPCANGLGRVNQPPQTNFIKFSDIERYVSRNISDRIRGCFM